MQMEFTFRLTTAEGLENLDKNGLPVTQEVCVTGIAPTQGECYIDAKAKACAGLRVAHIDIVDHKVLS